MGEKKSRRTIYWMYAQVEDTTRKLEEASEGNAEALQELLEKRADIFLVDEVGIVLSNCYTLM